MNSISLDAETKTKLGLDDCEVGKEETITIKIMPTSVKDGLEADVVDGGYAEEGPGENETPTPPKPAKKSRPAAVDAAMM